MRHHQFKEIYINEKYKLSICVKTGLFRIQYLSEVKYFSKSLFDSLVFLYKDADKITRILLKDFKTNTDINDVNLFLFIDNFIKTI